jgi:hypothetical protein
VQDSAETADTRGPERDSQAARRALPRAVQIGAWKIAETCKVSHPFLFEHLLLCQSFCLNTCCSVSLFV